MKNGSFYLFSFAFQKQGNQFCGKSLIWFMRICCLCVLIRCLGILEASLKGFNCCGGKLPLRCAGLRFAEPQSFLKKVLIVAVRSCGCARWFEVCRTSELPGKGTDCYFLHRAKSNQKARGAKPCDPRFKSPVDTFLKRKWPAFIKYPAMLKTTFFRVSPAMIWIGARFGL